MKKSTRLVIAIITALIAGGLGYWLVQTRSSVPDASTSPGPEASTASGPAGTATIGESTIRHSPGGRLAWKVKLDNIRLQSGGASVAAQGVREALIYDGKGKPLVRMTANTMSGNTRTRDLEVKGNVRVVSPEGAVFDTQVVRWVQAQKKIVCPETVTMRNKDTAVTALSAEFHVAQDLVKTTSKVQMTVGNNSVTGQGLTYNIKTEDFTLSSVQGVLNPETIRGNLRR